MDTFPIFRKRLGGWRKVKKLVAEKLNTFNGNFRQAEMVKAFLVAGEYRARFPR